MLRFTTALLITTFFVQSATAGLPPPAQPITVMTRNVYVGANIFRVIDADPILIVPTIAEVYATVVQTDFAARAQLLADEIQTYQPHLVGLQEVALVRRQSPGDVFLGNPVPATEIDMDYLQMLTDALAQRNLAYSVVASVDNADIELPLFTGPTLDDIRLTDRDVILVRDDVEVLSTSTGNYGTNVVINLSGAVIDFNRGYTSANVRIDGRDYRFVNTHLEVGGQPEVQGAQADELIAVLADESLPMIVVGDINASPQSPPEQAYARLADAGLVDLWNERAVDDDDPGLTCCFGETLDDPEPAFSSRIDVLLVRNTPSTAVDGVDAQVIGNTVQTASGLWPSDHAGVVATLRLLGPGDDGDQDGVLDGIDNCAAVFNPNQRDTDADNFGNACDPDLNQDGLVNIIDLGIFRERFASMDPDADFNGDGVVNAVDLGTMRSLFFSPPGPSATAGR